MTALILLAILLHAGFSLGKTATVKAAPNGPPTYVPSSVTADIGDTVKFEFYPQNHTVTESSYSNPCVPSDSGINSGFIPTTDGEANKYFLVPINNTDPIWFYCAQARHCQVGMVGVINPPNGSNTTTLEKYKSAAASAPSNVAATGGVMGGIIAGDEDNGSDSPTAPSPSETSTGTSTSTTSATATGGASVLSADNAVLGLLAASFWWLL